MEYEKELSKWGYNKNNSISVETLVSEILPALFDKKHQAVDMKQLILSELWVFCKKEFNADFEEDWINGYGGKTGMSDRSEKFSELLAKKINKIIDTKNQIK